MELGTIVFYRKKKEFDSVLEHMKVKPQALSIDDDLFKDFYGYDRQALFHVLYQTDNMWGFVASKINRKNGTKAWKVINADNKVSIIEDSGIYFALTMDDFTYTHWAEMEDEKKIKKSPHGALVMKKPSTSSIRKAKAVKTSFFAPEKMLYQIVSLTKGHPQYPASNPFNSQWDKYAPFQPTQNPYADIYKSMRTNPPQSNKPSPAYSKWMPDWSSNSTFHAVPFFRDNIKPTTFSIMRKVQTPANDLRMFINFPDGIPLNLT
jgi:hypothetical protein